MASMASLLNSGERPRLRLFLLVSSPQSGEDGALKNRFKEGDPTQCANYRGLLVEGQNLQEHHDHSVPTRLCGCIKVPTPLQCGCMNLRCAARAPHTTRTFLLCCIAATHACCGHLCSLQHRFRQSHPADHFWRHF